MALVCLQLHDPHYARARLIINNFPFQATIRNCLPHVRPQRRRGRGRRGVRTGRVTLTGYL